MNIHLHEKGNIIFSEAKMAGTFFTRLKGLQFKKSLTDEEALIITPCNSIHMFCMRFPIDVIFLDKDDVVVEIIHGIKPWRISKIYSKAHYVVECNKGLAQKIGIHKGDKLFFSTLEK